MTDQDRPLSDEERQLVEDNLGLATHFAQRFQASRMEFEDLVQEAYMGLIDAARLYKTSHGTRFSTYARWHILKKVMDAIHNRNEIVRTPRRRPSLICGSLTDAAAHALPDRALTPEEMLDRDETNEAIRQLIKELPHRDAIVLRLRYGVNTQKMTLREVGEILAVTPERVRQIQNAAEKKLRALLLGSAILNHGADTAGHQKEPAQPCEDETRYEQ